MSTIVPNYTIEGFFVEFHDFMELCDFLVHLPFVTLCQFDGLTVQVNGLAVCWINVGYSYYVQTGRYDLGFIDIPHG